MHTKKLELADIIAAAQDYSDKNAFEEAFICLWLITTQGPLFSEARSRIKPDSVTLRLKAEYYADLSDVEYLQANKLYNKHPLNTYIESSPLLALWILDRHLLSHLQMQRKSSRIIDVELAGEKHEYWLFRRDPNRILGRKVSEQFMDALRFCPGHGIVPRYTKGIEIKIEPLESITAERLQKFDTLDNLKVFYSHFDDDAMPERKPDSGNTGKFLFSGLMKEDAREAKLFETLAAAKDQGAHIVVFPELTITPKLHHSIVRWLYEVEDENHSIIWIVAGSFHEEISDDSGAWINRSYSFGYEGQIIHKHTKFCSYGTLDDKGYEDIKLWRDIWLVETPLGLVATPICLDFCNINSGSPSANIFSELMVDLCLVPAMDKSDSAHKRQAKNMKLFKGTRTVCAIQHTVDSSVSLSFDTNLEN